MSVYVNCYLEGETFPFGWLEICSATNHCWKVGDLFGYKSLYLSCLGHHVTRNFRPDKKNHSCSLLSLNSAADPMYYVVREFAVNLCIRILSMFCLRSSFWLLSMSALLYFVLYLPPNFWILLLSDSGWRVEWCSRVCASKLLEEMLAARIWGHCDVKS